MEKWTKLGKFIGSHMPIISPICVAAGVLFPEFFGETEKYVSIMFAIMTFQGSLNNTFGSVVRAFRHPLNMILILLMSMVVMSVVAYALASLLFAGNANLITGATLEYCVPVAVVSFMWVGMYEGDLALALATILVSTVIAPFSIPFTLQLLLGATVQVDVAGMMIKMIFMVALPAILGMLVNELSHGWGCNTLSPAIAPAVKILLIIIIASNSSQMADSIRHMTPQLFGMMAFILIYAACGFGFGLLLARLRHADQSKMVTLCFCTGLRNISAGCVIAAEFFPGEVVFPVMMGTLFQQILAGVFGSVMGKFVVSGNKEA